MNKAEPSSSKKRNVLLLISKLIGLIAYGFLLFFIYLLLMEFETNLFIVLLILSFVSLIFIGPFLKQRHKKRLYARIFPDKKKKLKEKYESKRNKYAFSKQTESKIRDVEKIDLNFKYRKPLIKKCNKCGMIVPGFSKKCPKCGEPVLD
ncbi:MAG: hypothetical protein GF383_05090 [Candidatus Lokiarchaeota archaeon]|nr:hypothetical protein [Candidatus Lokiarchaeota archaeon]MBD3339265.1 hypothetical protein [Candidatus Lokiarchaeota archaeon]